VSTSPFASTIVRNESSRTRIVAPSFNAVPLQVGKFQRAGAFGSGPKDTLVSPPGTITVWVGKYTIGTDGVSVWHCHILSHEDNAEAPMMRPLKVDTATQTQLPWVGDGRARNRYAAEVRAPTGQIWMVLPAARPQPVADHGDHGDRDTLARLDALVRK